MDELKHAARAAYERGRWWWAARVAFIVVPLVLLSLFTATQPVFNLVAGSGLLVATTWLRWRGGDWSAAAEIGLGAGAFAYLVPLAIPACGHCCAPGTACGLELGPCIAGGVLAGLIIGTRAGAARGVAFGVSAAGVAGLLGALTCAPFGAAVMAGMAGALVLTVGTVMVAARA